MLSSCSNSKFNSAFPLDMATTPDMHSIDRKRDAAQSSEMSAAAVSFFLDREGHKKFLRTATSQELEMRNKELVKELEDRKEDCDQSGAGSRKQEAERGAYKQDRRMWPLV